MAGVSREAKDDGQLTQGAEKVAGDSKEPEDDDQVAQDAKRNAGVSKKQRMMTN